MKIEVLRTYLPTETLGSFMVDDVCEAKTMELPWKDNQHNISCIPEGVYVVLKEEMSPKHDYPHFRIYGVPPSPGDKPEVKERTGILIHKITYVSGLLGCIGVGGQFADLNKDGVPDMVDSTKALNHLYSILPNKFQLTIRKK